MTDSKYEAYDNLTDENGVYYNNFGLTNSKDLETLEQIIVTNKLLDIEHYPKGNFNLGHLCEIHNFLFGDIYQWAGELRQVDISKGGTQFCHTTFIVTAFNKLYEVIKTDNFLKTANRDNLAEYLANYYSELNMIHPFRDGNGRALRAYLALMVFNSHKIVLSYHNTHTKSWMEASIASTVLNNLPLAKIFKNIVKNSL